jgi:hypothetical protein
LPAGTPDRLFYALSLLVIALFVASGMVRSPQWRPRLRLAAIVFFALAAAISLMAVVLWLV